MTDWEVRARVSYDRVAEPNAEATRGAVTSDPRLAGQRLLGRRAPRRPRDWARRCADRRT